jgi:glycosyltransferase involved in cell wall biosynthesis
MNIAIIGSAFPLRGGLSAFNERLAKQLIEEGNTVTIYTFSLQYPSFLFPGKTQFSSDSAPEGLNIKVNINSINPLNWLIMGYRIAKSQPDLVIYKFWLPFMGPCFGSIIRIVKLFCKVKVIAILDNVIPHEARPGDKILTKYGLSVATAAIAMSKSVQADFNSFFNNIKCQFNPHPIYDNFGEKISKMVARKQLNISIDDKVILFFGFIRNYKGLDLLLNAMSHNEIRKQKIKLIIAGEYYEDGKKYQDLIAKLDISNNVFQATDYIPNDDVKNYFCAADVIVQPYKTATQSGITQMAYHFEKPMIVTNVGGLPELVPHNKVGYVVAPNADEIANAILQFYKMPENNFLENIKLEKQKYSWSEFTEAINLLTK